MEKPANARLTGLCGPSITPALSRVRRERLRVRARLLNIQFTNGRSEASCPPWPLQETDKSMANTKSAKKAIRKMERRTAVNKNRRSRIRSFMRKVEEAIASGDQSAAGDALKAVQPEIMRAAQKGVLHKNTASRKVSRLAQRVKALGA